MDPLDGLPEGDVFEGAADSRFVALALEALVQDMSPVGDGETARQLGGYTLGEEPPPESAPDYVSLEGDRLRLANEPFLVGEIRIERPGDPDGGEGSEGGSAGEGDGEYRLRARLDSELNLLIDPPVAVTFSGSLSAAVESMEGTLAQVYRTKGRYLEQIDAGVVDPTG
jgi:hypothetical protein